MINWRILHTEKNSAINAILTSNSKTYNISMINRFSFGKNIFEYLPIMYHIIHALSSRVNETYYSIMALNKCQGTPHDSFIV